MAQRLVRQLCPHCRAPHEPAPAILQKCQNLQKLFPQLLTGTPQWFQAVGCKQCQNTGYRGRLGIYEMALVTDELADMVLHQKSIPEMAVVARKSGYRDLLEDGLIKAWQGSTSVEEVLRVAGQMGVEGD